MAEVGAQYTGAEIMLTQGDKMARGHVVAQSHNASGNMMGRTHANPTMDTRLYPDDFAGRMLQNLLSMSLLSQCMPNAMQMGMSTYSWMHCFITIEITRPFP